MNPTVVAQPPAVKRERAISARAVSLVAEATMRSTSIQRAIAGYCYAAGKRPASHPANLLHAGRLAIPLCAVFLRDALTQHASVAAFDFLGLRESTTSTADLRSLGFDVPPGRARFRWLVFDDPAEREVYADAHDMLGALGIDAPHPEEDQAPWAPFAPDALPVDARVPCRCPFHADRKASATIYPPSHLGYGAGVCHACVGSDGAPLRFCWRRLPDGSLGVRVARRHRVRFDEVDPEIHRKNVGRYNGRPIGPPGLVRRVHGATVGVSLRSWTRPGTGWRSSAGTARLSGDVISAIVRAERSADYGNVRPQIVDHEFEPAARRASDPARPPTADIRDRLVRVQPQVSTSREPAPWGSVESGWKDAGVANVLLDLDGLRLGDDAAARRWANEVLGIVSRDPRCSGRATVVRTSDGGAQVVVELARPVAGILPAEAWWSTDGARSWYRSLGERALAAAHAAGAEGGEIDWSAVAPCRLARRPGWRVTKDATTYRARLLAACIEQRAAA